MKEFEKLLTGARACSRTEIHSLFLMKEQSRINSSLKIKIKIMSFLHNNYIKCFEKDCNSCSSSHKSHVVACC